MHYLGPIPNAIYVAGVASMALLLALVTGLLIHWKDLVRQWFQFRPERVRRTWSSDLHKVLGVFGLPYQLLYAWSGAVLCLSSVTVEPAFKAAVFGGDERALAVARGDAAEAAAKPTGRLSDRLPDLDALVARARREVPGLRPTWVGIEHPGDEASTVSVSGELDGLAFGGADVTLRASDGAVLRVQGPANATSSRRFEAWFYGLHYARFGGYGVKFLYALLAFATCAVIASGNLVWLERRDRARAHAGNRLLERLTVSFCAGAPLATAAMVASNRLLPAGLASRAALEQVVFWASWALYALAPFVARSRRRAAGAGYAAAGALFALAPLVDVASRPGRLADPLHRGVGAAFALLAVACGAGAAALLRRSPSAAGAAAPARDAPERAEAE